MATASNLDQTMLETRVAQLQEENRALKEQLTQLAMENSQYQHTVLTKEEHRQEHRQRWAYYHAHKARIRREILAQSRDPYSTVLSWVTVKRTADQEFFAQKN